MRARPAAALAALAIMVALPAAVAQQMYRWVDKDGRVHFSQQPPPRDAAKSVEQRKMVGGGGGGEAPLPFALQQAVKNFPVVLYTSPGCKGCDEARALLAKRGIPYRETSVQDPKSIDVLKGATGDDKVPSMTVGRQVQKGYLESAMHDLLDSAGYPRTAMIPVKPPAPQQAAKDAGTQAAKDAAAQALKDATAQAAKDAAAKAASKQAPSAK
jgi:glutaredoxin